MSTLSNNGFSLAMQADDVLAWLRINHTEQYCTIRREFPESLIFDGASLDHERMGVDVVWIYWLVDAIEQTALVVWVDGEPFTADIFDAMADDEREFYGVG